MKYLPIINFTKESTQDLAELKAKYFSTLNQCAKKYQAIEFSLVSYRIFDFLPELILEAHKLGLEVNFGSAIETLLLIDLETLLKSVNPEKQKVYKVFAPAFDQEVFEFCSIQKYFDYVPGVFSRSDLKEIRNLNLKVIKVFPYHSENADDFLSKLQAPYIELRNTSYSKEGTKLISPREYQKIRQEYLDGQHFKLRFEPDLSNKLSLDDLKDFSEIYLTGIDKEPIVNSVGDNVTIASRSLCDQIL